jgi:hypothetical protein
MKYRFLILGVDECAKGHLVATVDPVLLVGLDGRTLRGLNLKHAPSVLEEDQQIWNPLAKS